MEPTNDLKEPETCGSNEPHCSAFEFDQYPGLVGRVEVREDDSSTMVVICLEGKDQVLIHANRDQWGVFVSTSEMCVAQEDGTRSFTGALLLAIALLRAANEIDTTAPTPVEPGTSGPLQGQRELQFGDVSVTFSAGDLAKLPTESRPQDWGREPIEVLAKHGLKPAKVESLRAAADAGNFNGTIRGLRDWIAKSDLWHRNVKGFGEIGINKLIDALASYCKTNPMPDQPMNAEDEKLSEMAAIALGHTKQSVMECEATPIAVVPDAVVEPTQIATEVTPPVEPATAEQIEVDPHPEGPIVSGSTKRPRKSRVPNKPKPAPAGTFHDAKNAGQLDRVEAIMSGESDPAATITTEAEAKLTGEAAGMSDVSCSANPFPRDHAFGKAWQAGWEATATGVV